MITLNDCIGFCEMPPSALEKIAQQQNLPIVMACAYAHVRGVSANDSRSDKPCSPTPVHLAA